MELPTGLTYLGLSNTQLKSLLVLHSGLTRLLCDGCTQLASLPELPEGLTRFWCNGCVHLSSDELIVLNQINLSENMERERDEFLSFCIGQKDSKSIVYDLPSDVFSLIISFH